MAFGWWMNMVDFLVKLNMSGLTCFVHARVYFFFAQAVADTAGQDSQQGKAIFLHAPARAAGLYAQQGHPKASLHGSADNIASPGNVYDQMRRVFLLDVPTPFSADFVQFCHG